MKKTHPIVTIGIIAYNYDQYLGHAIQSALDQTASDSLEVLVIDDCSTDDTETVVHGFAKDPRVRYIKNEHNLGTVLNANKCLAHARGCYFLLLGADDFLLPGAIKSLLNVVENDGNVDLVYGRYVIADGQGVVNNLVNHPGHKKFSYLGERNEFADLLRYDCYINMGASLFRKTALQSMGFFDDQLKIDDQGRFFRATDYDLMLRLSAAGKRFAFVNQLMSAFRVHGNQASVGDNYLKEGIQLKEHLELLEKYIVPENHSLIIGHQQSIIELFKGKIRNFKQYPTEYAALYPAIENRINTVIEQLESLPQTEPKIKLKTNPLVSIIIPTRNRPLLLINAMESISRQTYSHWEAIVINDGGDDIGALIAYQDVKQQFRYIDLKYNQGQGAARNAGLSLARGDIVCYLDDDDRYKPDHLKTVVDALQQGQEAFVYTDIDYVLEKVNGQQRTEVSRTSLYEHGNFDLEKLYIENYIPINTWAHLRHCLPTTGVFDETYPSLEDWEFLLRLTTQFGGRHIPRKTVEVRHRIDQKDNISFLKKHTYPDVYHKIYQKHTQIKSSLIDYGRKKMLSSFEHGHADVILPKSLQREVNYRKWLDKQEPQEGRAQIYAERMMSQWTNQPTLHLVIWVNPNDNSLLLKTLDSLNQQLYGVWGLTILSPVDCPDQIFTDVENIEWLTVTENVDVALNNALNQAGMDWFALLEAGDTLPPHSLFSIADYINARPDWRFIYFDDDFISLEGERSKVRFKPDFNFDLLCNQFYLGDCCFIHRETLQQQSQVMFLPGASSYDAAFRILESHGEQAIGHIADVLLTQYRETVNVVKEGELENLQRQLLKDHFSRVGLSAQVLSGLLPETRRVTYMGEERPLVSVIIPVRDNLKFLQPCVESLFAKTDYPNFEIILVDNGSMIEDTFDFFSSLQEKYQGSLQIVADFEDYSVARLLNKGVESAKGEYVVFLASDMQVVQSQWMERLYNHACRTDVGVVGGRLLAPDKTIIHAGMILGMAGSAGYIHFGETYSDQGYQDRLQNDQNVSAVSLAGMMVRKSLFTSLNGFDLDYQISFADVDFCLRMTNLGKKTVWTPYSTLSFHNHVELFDRLSTEKIQHQKQSERDQLLSQWLPQLARDPAYNQNLSLNGTDVDIERDLMTYWDQNFHNKPRILGFPLDKMALGYYRVYAPLWGLEKAAKAEVGFYFVEQGSQHFPTVTDMARVNPDVLLLQGTIQDNHLATLEDYRKHKSDMFVVADLEDLKTDVPDSNSKKRFLFKDMKHRTNRWLQQCDRLIVTTEPLKEASKGMIDDIVIVPNRLDKERWGNVTSLKRTAKKPRVGWIGAQQHHGDLLIIAEVVKQTSDIIDWVFMGMSLDELKPFIAEEHSFVSYNQYPEKMASLNLDLAIAPLEFNAFNEAKSNLRLLEYGSMKWPVICTDIEPFRYLNPPVKRVKNNTQDWLNAVKEYAFNLEEADKQAEQLHQWVKQHFMLEDHLDEWYKALLP
ncbi:MAG: glycosyltransferase [Methylococcaceae bacterium]